MVPPRLSPLATGPSRVVTKILPNVDLDDNEEEEEQLVLPSADSLPGDIKPNASEQPIGIEKPVLQEPDNETTRREVDELYAFYLQVGARVEEQHQSRLRLEEGSAALFASNGAQAKELLSLREHAAELDRSLRALHDTIVHDVQAPDPHTTQR